MSSAGVIPERIGPYHPLALLGRGGMGAVYRAEHTSRPGQYVALKVILESTGTETEEARRRFEREARLLEGLRHPNIVSFLDVGLDGYRQYFAMELLEGHSLLAYVGRPCHVLAPLLIQICQGMHYLASRSIVHRDLSPGNILIVDEGKAPVAKILDFGIAKDIESSEALENLTRTGVLMGKPRYWSPEQLGSLGSSRLLDWRSDIYALGVIFFQLFSGQLPFDCETPFQYASAHLYQPPPPLEAPPDHPPLPEAVRAIVLRMLAKSPDERPEYREIIEVLAQVIEAETTPTVILVAPTDLAGVAPITASTVSPSPSPPMAPVETHQIASSPVPRRYEVRTAIGVTLAGVVVLALAAFLLARLRSPQLAPVPLPDTQSSAQRAPSESTAPPPASVVGFLNLDAVPWARVETIVNQSTGRRIPVADDLTTPVSLEMPPGQYRVEIVCGPCNERRSLAIDVKAGSTTWVNEGFGEPRDLLALLD